MRSGRAAITTAAVLCGLLTSCTGEGGSDKPNVPDATPSTVAPPPQEPLTAPEVDAGYEEILSEGPHHGVRQFGTIELPKGESWIKVNCISRAKPVDLELSLEKIGGFSVGCSGVGVERTANQTNLDSARKVHFTVVTEESVRWCVSIQVPKR
ncbi:hypothetical protein ACH5AO_07885 [Streptomyces sp. NPDC018964]|uniref:hypothetical protein n=1 Tax=Streptomyces sp. NPDC018964 TaxID=3365058 RepID=UPI0037B9EEF8